jgi:GTP-binding protein HflX
MNESLKGILIGVNYRNREDDFTHLMEELRGLAFACDIEIVGEVTQNMDQINSSHYLGKGKIEELKALIEYTEANLLIANDELSPSQIRVLEDKLEIEAIDRTMLILDIFARRARTREAKLQVEVARLQYMLPRLVGRKIYDQQGGGSGFANRGAGETGLELDRRKIEDRISNLKKELDLLASRRKIQRRKRKRSGLPLVSLVGYTNAGKSTIMNKMIELFQGTLDKQVFEKDMLFATLETTVRKIVLPDNKAFLLTDTVGFINKLPHHLVKAFHSTLEEVTEADLLIHVVDCSDSRYETFIEVTNKTLEEIGGKDIPIIYAFNKADLTDLQIPLVKENIVYLSAREKVGLDELIGLIRKNLFEDYVCCEFLFPFDRGELISYFHENATVLKTSYEENGTLLQVECRASDYERYQDYAVSKVK